MTAPGYAKQLVAQKRWWAKRRAFLNSPHAIKERKASITAYQGQTPSQALTTDQAAYPAQVAPSGYQSLDPARGKVVRKLNDSEAIVKDASGRTAMAVGTLPLYGTAPDGSSAPVDLSLVDNGSSFTEKSAVVPVSIPKSSADEIRFQGSQLGIQLQSPTAVTGDQSGGGVFYPSVTGAGNDTDAVAQPVPTGAEISYILRSAASPTSQTLVFDLPSGWTLGNPDVNTGSARIMSADGKVAATILPPTGIDAQGQTVPVSYQVKQPNQLVISESTGSGSYAYPILVDPVVDWSDPDWSGNQIYNTWIEGSDGSSSAGFVFSPTGSASEIAMENSDYYAAGIYGEYYEVAPPGAYIYELDESGVEHHAYQSFEYGGLYKYDYSGWEPGTWENVTNLSGGSAQAEWDAGGSMTSNEYLYCARSGCAPSTAIGSGPKGGNIAVFGLKEWNAATQSSTNPAHDWVTDATLYLADNQVPSITSVTHAGIQPNAWVANATDTVSVTASVSTGLGMNELLIGGASAPAVTASCSSLSNTGPGPLGGSTLVRPCPLNLSGSFTYNTSGLSDGPQSITVSAWDGGGNGALTSWTVNVDKTAPTLSLSGPLTTAPPTLDGGTYALNMSATDGTGAVKVSGVQKFEVDVDGTPQSGLASYTPCAAGQTQCTVSSSWTLDSSQLSSGSHTITVTATDGAGNTATKTIDVNVVQAPDEAIGPGSVNLGSGEFSLDATDVSLPGFGGDLTVSRSYASEHVGTSAPGPLGPGWSVSLPQGSDAGSFQSLQVNPDGTGVTLTDAGGAQTKWSPDASNPNTFDPPPGLENLSLQGSAQPQLSESADLPTTGAGPAEMTVGPDGAIWFTEYSSDKIGRIDPAKCTRSGCPATAVTEYKVPTASAEPWGITTGADGNVWFTEYAVGKVARLIPSQATAGTSNGITEYSSNMTASSEPAGIAAGPDGALWFAEWSGQIGRICPSSTPANCSAGTGTITQTTIPGGSAAYQITAGSDGAMWFVDDGNNTIGRITTASTPSISLYPIPTAGAWPTGITTGPDGALWFTEYFGNKIGRITTAGAVTEYNVPTSNSRPLSIVEGGDGNLWFTEYTGSKIASLAPGSASPNTTKGFSEYTPATTGSQPYGLVAGPDDSNPNASDLAGNLWFSEWAGNKIGAAELSGYTLTDAGGGPWRVFAPSGDGVYQATTDTQPNSSAPDGVVTSVDTYQPGTGDSAGSMEPLYTSASAPGNSYPDGSCDATPQQQQNDGQQGCRTLSYTYATSAAARADCPNGWGDYAGRLTTISYSAYNVNADSNYAQGYNTVAVARYCYDSTGLLRAEFDPRICDSIGGNCTELPTEYSYNSTGQIMSVTPPGETAWTINYGTIPGNIDSGALMSVSRQDPNPANGPATTSVVYNVPLSGSEAPHAMGPSDVAAWGQADTPQFATAIFPPDSVPAIPPSNYIRATIYYIDSNGNEVNIAEPGGSIATSEYDANGNEIRSLTPNNRALSLTYGPNSVSESHLLDTEYAYNSSGTGSMPAGTELLTTIGPQHEMSLAGGVIGLGRSETIDRYDENAPASATEHGLLTSETTEASDGSDAVTTTSDYSGQGGLGWSLGKPTSMTIDPNGLNNVRTTLYDPATGAVIETRSPANPSGGDAHATQTTYYTAATDAMSPDCGNAIALAGLPCKRGPAAQPETAGLPSVGMSTYRYNVWDEQTSDTTDVTPPAGGADQRIVSNSYDAAGRLTSVSTTATDAGGNAVGEALPPVMYGYDASSGRETTVSTPSNGQSIVRTYNSVGELTSYTDADGQLSTYTYDVDGRQLTLDDGKGTQTNSYDPVTGAIAALADSGAGTFAATYDADGNMLTETYPNGMTAQFTYDATDAQTGVLYTAPSGCSEGCTWYTDSYTTSDQGNVIAEQATNVTRGFAYDSAGRLVQETMTVPGKPCSTSAYGYDADGNRVTQTTIAPNEDGSCGAAGGTTQTHSYDSADRLVDPGVSYDSWGDIAALPAVDAGGSELVNAYFANGTLASASQGGVAITDRLDPTLRMREVVTTDATSTSDEIEHFADSTDVPSWTQSGTTWTRNIIGIEGGMSGQETPDGTTFFLTNLHGDTVGTVADSSAATPVLSTPTDSFGNPDPGSALAPYGYLGGKSRLTLFKSGVMSMGSREYLPQLGEFAQVDPAYDGSGQPYTYVNDDPMDGLDLTGAYSCKARYNPHKLRAYFQYMASLQEAAFQVQNVWGSIACSGFKQFPQEIHVTLAIHHSQYISVGEHSFQCDDAMSCNNYGHGWYPMLYVEEGHNAVIWFGMRTYGFVIGPRGRRYNVRSAYGPRTFGGDVEFGVP